MPYSSIGKANPAIRGIKPPVSLSQANGIAAIADELEETGGVESPWAVALSQFKKSHKVKGGKWVKKSGSKFGKKSVISEFVGRLKATLVGEKQDDAIVENVFTCECLECGHVLDTKEHCVDVKCPECGGEMRREDRPGPGRKDYSAGVKAFEAEGGKYLVLWTSNAFEDREREIFSTKSWEDYVARVDNHPEVNPGRVWFWHVKGSDFADIVWQDVIGRLVVEVAKVDDTPRGAKMFRAFQHPEEYPDLLPQGWGTSHGYLYRGGDKEAGVYGFVHKFESTVLPAHRASNLYGKLREVLDMSVSAEKQAALAELFGSEEAAKIIGEAQKASDDLEGSGVAFKAKGDEKEEGKKKVLPKGFPPKKVKKVPPVVDGDEEEDEDEEEEGEGEKEAFYELEMDEALLKEIASHVSMPDFGVAVKQAVAEALQQRQDVVEAAVKEAVREANLGSKEEIVQQALAGKLRLTPYVASKDDDNVIPGDEIKAEQKARGTTEPDDVVAGVVQRMLQGR